MTTLFADNVFLVTTIFASTVLGAGAARCCRAASRRTGVGPAGYTTPQCAGAAAARNPARRWPLRRTGCDIIRPGPKTWVLGSHIKGADIRASAALKHDLARPHDSMRPVTVTTAGGGMCPETDALLKQASSARSASRGRRNGENAHPHLRRSRVQGRQGPRRWVVSEQRSIIRVSHCQWSSIRGRPQLSRLPGCVLHGLRLRFTRHPQRHRCSLGPHDWLLNITRE